MIRGAAATGIINLVAAAIVSVFLLRRVVSTRQLVTALCALAAALGAAGHAAGAFARHRDDQQATALRRPDHRLPAHGVSGDRGHPPRQRHPPLPRRRSAVLHPRRIPLHRKPGLPRARQGRTIGAGTRRRRRPGRARTAAPARHREDRAGRARPRGHRIGAHHPARRQRRRAGQPARQGRHRRRDELAARPGTAVRPAASTRSSSTCPTRTHRCWGGCIPPSSTRLSRTRWPPAGSWSCSRAARFPPRRRSGARCRRSGPPATPSRRITCTCPRSVTGVSRWHAAATPRRYPACRRCAAAALPQPASAASLDGVLRRHRAPHAGALDAGQPAHRRGHAPRLRLISPRRARPAPRRTGRRWCRRSARRRCLPARRRA